jgi:hypothetical protein
MGLAACPIEREAYKDIVRTPLTIPFLPNALPGPSSVPPRASARFLADFRRHPKESAMSVRHLNQIELARRWNISPRTLERWRWLGQGPVYLKLGGRVSYRLDDVVDYEDRCLHANTIGPLQTDASKGRA